MAKRTENDSQLATSGDHLTNGKDGSNPGNHNEAPVAADEVVRSKLHPQRQYQSSTATCGADGVKSISDILNSADEQLKVSQQFAEKLARRRYVKPNLDVGLIQGYMCSCRTELIECVSCVSITKSTYSW